MQRLRAFSSRSGRHSNPDSAKDYDAVTPSPKSPTPLTKEAQGELSPELAPIVTLLSAQMNRKYFEGFFMLLRDLTAEGKPAERRWQEVYGILIGNELSYWSADELKSGDVDAENKPSYINFTDATLKAEATLPSGQGELNNVIIASTTLKNRYLLQYSSSEQFYRWRSAFRLAEFEYRALQEAYTAALLSARGSLLSDIRVILAETKFDREDWVSVRFGAGMPWKRCFCVIKQSKKKKHKKKNSGMFGDGSLGEVMFFETEKRSKKALPIATIKEADSIYAVYPRNYMVIDHSTMVKLDGQIVFDEKEGPRQCSIFMMPEQHSAVPGYDTMIRFMIPLLDAFRLYGRPKRLNADKTDPDSLLFALPVLPNVHYLEVQDLMQLCSSSTSLSWTPPQWDEAVKRILRVKMGQGYTGCGSVDGVDGAIRFLDASKDMARGKIRTISSSVAASRPKVLGSKFSVASSSQSSLATDSILSEKIANDDGQKSGSMSTQMNGQMNQTNPVGRNQMSNQSYPNNPINQSYPNNPNNPNNQSYHSNQKNSNNPNNPINPNNPNNQNNQTRYQTKDLRPPETTVTNKSPHQLPSLPDFELYPGGDENDHEDISAQGKPIGMEEGKDYGYNRDERRPKKEEKDYGYGRDERKPRPEDKDYGYIRDERKPRKEQKDYGYFNDEREPEREETPYHHHHHHHHHQHREKHDSPEHEQLQMDASPGSDQKRDSGGKIVSIYKRYAQFPPLREKSMNDIQSALADGPEEEDELYPGVGGSSDAPAPPVHGSGFHDEAKSGRLSPQKSDLSFSESSGLSSPEKDEPDFQLPILKKPANTGRVLSPFSEFHETFHNSMGRNLNYADGGGVEDSVSGRRHAHEPAEMPAGGLTPSKSKRDRRIAEQRRREREKEVRIEMQKRKKKDQSGEKKLLERRVDKNQAATPQLQIHDRDTELSPRRSQRLSSLRRPPPGSQNAAANASNSPHSDADPDRINAQNEKALAQMTLGGTRTPRSPDISRNMNRFISAEQPGGGNSSPDKHSSSRYPSTIPQQAASQYQQGQYDSIHNPQNTRSGVSRNPATSGSSRQPNSAKQRYNVYERGQGMQQPHSQNYQQPHSQKYQQPLPQNYQSQNPQQPHSQNYQSLHAQQPHPQNFQQYQQYPQQYQQYQHYQHQQMPAQPEYSQARYQQQTYQQSAQHHYPARQPVRGQPYSSPDYKSQYGSPQQTCRDNQINPYIREN
ncbi:hypothetical protein HII12_002736 [Brettanomyces bruxellensis]|uniref:PH domain-containing protein n=1 Tax=Dekkera bruxellensis TaxID=5007 RepID=A0A8H6BGS7_DEKBR|nr:hypothetical protein HII12_002736 [Brettanomyces bruxellensis]